LILILSLVSLCILFAVKPYKDVFTNRIEIFNEITVYINSLIQLQFIQESNNFRKLQKVKKLLGWLVISNVGFNITINVSIVAFQTMIGASQGLMDKFKSLHFGWMKYKERRIQKSLTEAFGHEILPE
jgi:hypothetical protein